MKLKYYLRGIGAGILFAALIFSFVVIPRKTKMSDEEVKERIDSIREMYKVTIEGIQRYEETNWFYTSGTDLW